tara:strand:+ start:485 stop:964 length:480 start_codon:yes stop_codon:yes gene_type:complete
MGGPSGGNSNGGNNRTQFGYTKPKSTVSKVVDFVKGGGVVGAVVRGITQGAKKSKQNAMDYEGQAAGVTAERSPKDPRTGLGGDNNNNQKSIEQPKVKSQMNNTDVKSDMITAKAPAITEMSADEIAIKNKRKGRKKTILTSVTGVNEYPTLSNKTLLG